ncbi:MAG: hypothetical protein WCJ70_04755 [bacterium]
MASISFNAALAADTNVNFQFATAGDWAEQVISMTRLAGPALKSAEEVALIGLPAAGIGQVGFLELCSGLPTITLWAFLGGKPARVGSLNLGVYRHQTVRPLRALFPEGGEFPGYSVIDGGGRGLPPHQLQELAALLGCQPEDLRVLDGGMGQSDLADPTKGVAEKLLSFGLTKADWSSGRLIYVPPGNGLIAVVQATAIYALSEVWPRVGILQTDQERKFHVQHLLDVQGLRASGPALAAQWAADQTATLVAAVAQGIGAQAAGNTLTVQVDGKEYVLVITSASVS